MRPEQQEFTDLRRLLKFKRYEAPPFGYFDHFSSGILARLEDSGAAPGTENWLEWGYSRIPWLERLVNTGGSKPYLAWGMGAGVCAAIISTVVLSEKMEYTAPSNMPLADNGLMTTASTGLAGIGLQPAQGQVNSSNQPAGSLFDQIPPPQVESATGHSPILPW